MSLNDGYEMKKKIPLLYFDLYSNGNKPVSLRKPECFWSKNKPTSKLLPFTVLPVDSNILFADSIFTRCRYSTGVLPVLDKSPVEISPSYGKSVR